MQIGSIVKLNFNASYFQCVSRNSAQRYSSICPYARVENATVGSVIYVEPISEVTATFLHEAGIAGPNGRMRLYENEVTEIV